jgi:catechol 2,3-dioxygenase-like lactoylglutathione lyase family enzyme
MESATNASAGQVDMNLEVHVIPVSDVDRARQFYESLGWRLDDDVAPMDGLRIVQLTPPGSNCSVTFGQGLTEAAPGSAQAALTVSDIVAAHKDLIGRGVDAVDVWHGPPFPVEARQKGADPDRASYGSFTAFADPDGNAWLVQEVTTRHPGQPEVRGALAKTNASAGQVDMNLEVHVIPVSDVDRARQFYESLGWRLDDDVAPMDGLRIVQLTPPGSNCSVTFGQGLTEAAPGSAQAALTVSDIVAAHKDLIGRGVDAVDVWHGPPFPVEARQKGADPDRASYGSFTAFADPDGNAWLVQEVTTRHPGRV